MTHSEAARLTAQYNYNHNEFPIGFVTTYLFMAGIPITIIFFVIKGDLKRDHFIYFNDAITHRERLVKNMSLKT